MGNSLRKAGMSGSDVGRKGAGKKKGKTDANQSSDKPTILPPAEDAALQKKRRDLRDNLDLFVLNNVLLGVQFVENYDRFQEALQASKQSDEERQQNKQLKDHRRHCISPDALSREVSKHVVFKALHGPDKNCAQPLLPTRIFVIQENVKVKEDRNKTGYSDTGDVPTYPVTIQPAKALGYVKIRILDPPVCKKRNSYETISTPEANIDTTSSPPQQPVQSYDEPSRNQWHIEEERSVETTSRCQTNKLPSDVNNQTVCQSETKPFYDRLSPPSSQSSGYKSLLQSTTGSDTDYGYTTITDFKTPKPVEMRRLGNVPSRSTELPNECFIIREIPKLSFDDSDEESNPFPQDLRGRITQRKLYETCYYLNSAAYAASFGDIFVELLSQLLGFPARTTSLATMQGANIYCDVFKIVQKIQIKTRTNIIPAIHSENWPTQAFEWLHRTRKYIRDQRTGITYVWPTQNMVRMIQSKGVTIIPQGNVLKRGGLNTNHHMEWQLAFPEAESYLEARLLHQHVRCFLFTMAIYKSFLEPLVDGELSLSPSHIRTILLWECEENFPAWREDRPGDSLIEFLQIIYRKLSKHHLKDYFIRKRNLFDNTPQTYLRKIQEKLARVLENILIFTLSAVRNLHYVDERNFYPILDYYNLYKILTTDDIVTLINPNVGTVITEPRTIEDSEEDGYEFMTDEDSDSANDNDRERAWKRKRHLEMKAKQAANRMLSATRRLSVDSIDYKVLPLTGAHPYRRKLILELFIPHFINMAKRSNEFRAVKQALMYVTHVHHLVILLSEERNSDPRDIHKWQREINDLKDAINENLSSFNRVEDDGKLRTIAQVHQKTKESKLKLKDSEELESSDL